MDMKVVRKKDKIKPYSKANCRGDYDYAEFLQKLF